MPLLTDGSRDVALGYCTNVHPGETLDAVEANLRRHAAALRRRLAPAGRLGVGLWLPHPVVRELRAAPARLERLREALEESGLFVFTLNAFPYEAFHGRRVKERVFRPTWLERARVEFTEHAAEILAALLPRGVQGSLSTLPGSFKPFGDTPRIRFEIATHLLRCVSFLHRLRRATGRTITLGLEPEPLGTLETTWEVVSFFQDDVLRDGRHTVAQECGLSRRDAERAIRRHLGVCFDTCHQAAQFEDLEESLRLLADRGIRVAKVQLSNALACGASPRALDAMGELARSRYLHQVILARGPGEIWRFRDTPPFLASGQGLLRRGVEARIHFHAPLDASRVGPFRTTREQTARALRGVLRRGVAEAIEIETYTWPLVGRLTRRRGDVARDDIAGGIERELCWALDEARALGFVPREKGPTPARRPRA